MASPLHPIYDAPGLTLVGCGNLLQRLGRGYGGLSFVPDHLAVTGRCRAAEWRTRRSWPCAARHRRYSPARAPPCAECHRLASACTAPAGRAHRSKNLQVSPHRWPALAGAATLLFTRSRATCQRSQLPLAGTAQIQPLATQAFMQASVPCRGWPVARARAHCWWHAGNRYHGLSLPPERLSPRSQRWRTSCKRCKVRANHGAVSGGAQTVQSPRHPAQPGALRSARSAKAW